MESFKLIKLSLIALTLWLNSPLAGAADFKKPEVLILIGYTDDSALTFPAIHYNSLSQFLVTSLRSALKMQDYKLSPVLGPGQSELWEGPRARIRLLNVNVVCPGEQENMREASRWQLCSAQEQQITTVREVLEKSLTVNYDEFIYIGHARQGDGLGLGPNNPAFTESIGAIFNSGLNMRLHRVVMATCNATSNYGRLARDYHVEFVGMNEYRVEWDDDLSFALQELFRLSH